MAAKQQVAIRVQTEGKAEVKRDWQEIGQAGTSAHDAIARSSDQASAAADRQMAKYRAMAQAAREAGHAAEQQAKFNAILGVGAAPGKSAQDSAAAFEELLGPGGAANGNSKLNRVQQMMLQSAGFRTFESLASGMPLSRIVLQQGGEVAAALGMGEGGLGGALSAVSKLITPLTLTVGGLTAALGFGAAAAMAHADALAKLDLAAQGLGSTSGLTSVQLNEMAVAGAKMGDVSVKAGRDMASAYVSTGRIGGGVIEQLIGVTSRYAAVTGQDAKKAAQELAKAFADPARGADELNAKLHFLDDATVRYIDSLAAQGRATDAQAALAAALNERLAATPTHLNAISGLLDRLKVTGVNAFDQIGAAIDRAFGGGSDVKAHIARLQARLQNPLDDAVYGPALRRKIAELQAQDSAQTASATSAKTDMIAADARAAMAKINPLPGRLTELQGQRSAVQAGIGAGALDPQGLKEAQADLAKINAEIRAVSAGYSSAADQAAKLKEHTRQLEEAQRKVEEAARKAAAEAKKRFEQEEKLETIYANNRLTLAKIRAAGGDPEAKRAVAEAEEGARVQQLINQYLQAGLPLIEARRDAEHQVGEEKRAQIAATIDGIQADALHLKTLQDALKLAGPMVTDNDRALKTLGATAESAFDKITDPHNWTSWRDVARSAIQDIIAELIKLAVINPIKNAIFDQSNPTAGGGFWSSVFSAIGSAATGTTTGSGAGAGHNALGTDDWRGGATWVGEAGPELVNLPRGAQVFSNARSQAMGAPSITIHMDARGADASAARSVQLQLDRLRAELPSLVVKHANDGIARRRIK